MESSNTFQVHSCKITVWPALSLPYWPRQISAALGARGSIAELTRPSEQEVSLRWHHHHHYSCRQPRMRSANSFAFLTVCTYLNLHFKEIKAAHFFNGRCLLLFLFLATFSVCLRSAKLGNRKTPNWILSTMYLMCLSC